MEKRSRLYTQKELDRRRNPIWGRGTRDLQWYEPRLHANKPVYMRYRLQKTFKCDIFNVFWFRIKFRDVGGTLRDALELCNTTLVRKGFDFKDYVEKRHSHRNIKPCKLRS